MPTPFRNRIAVCAAALLTCCGAGVAAAQAPPGVPGLQSERFRLVVEGEAQAVRDLDLGGSTPICNAQVNVHITETAVWRRGRGVVVEFTRLGTGPRAPVIMRRVGNAVPVFTAVGTITRRSSGSATRTPVGAPDACPPASEDLSAGPDCGVPQKLRTSIALGYANGLLRIRNSGLLAVEDIACPVSQVYGGTPDLRYGWPNPPPLRPELIAPALVFGGRQAFVIRLASPRARTSQPISSGPLTGNATDVGQNRVTVRFIRLP
ncbi:MAG TPA: hypothetical protein PKD59_04465 [Miltoncostaeaceae bacterium]|nr:hypothetical protein [Miltoncostaeaceae bacterium]